MNRLLLDKKHDEMSEIWCDFTSILEKIGGLGEFNADRFVSIIEAVGPFVGNDPSYNNLVEKMADFVSNRKGEAEGALILLKRAKNLDFSDNFDMIRLLGKAGVGLTKKEYSNSFIEALQLLTLAYRSAGLLWSARASCISLAASLVIEWEEESCLPMSFAPTMKIWAWISLELRYLPDFLFAIQMLQGVLPTLPLTEDYKTKINNDISELDVALGSLFLNLDESELCKLTSMPDILDALGLFMARSALLYTLGHIDALRADGSLPTSESDEEINRVFSMFASQPVAQNLRGAIILNNADEQTLSTAILGMVVEINMKGSTSSILVAETILASLEAFFATAIEQHVVPHTEKLWVELTESDDISLPSFKMNKMDMTGTLIWPSSLSLGSYGKQNDIRAFLLEVSGQILSVSFAVKDIKKTLEKLCVNDVVLHRIAMVASVTNSYSRVASKSISRMSDWQGSIENSYKLQANRPTLALVKFESKETSDNADRSQEPPDLNDHRKLSVRSIIDMHAWDKARWKGTAYAQISPSQPAYIAFLFENIDAGRTIFERWIKRFGTEDKSNEINLSIICHLPHQNKHHYCLHIAPSFPKDNDINNEKIVTMPCRFKMMTPDNGVNLERFLDSYHHFGAYYLLPAKLDSNGSPKLLFDLAILKQKIIVKLAANVGENDIESMVLHKFRPKE